MQSLAGLAQPVFEQPGHVFLVVTVERAGGVLLDRALQALEQVLVVDDGAVFLVVAVQPVHAADGLEQAVVAHLLVDVEAGGRGRVEAGQELVHHDEQLHLARLFDELLLYRLLERLDLVHRRLGRLVEPVCQHPFVDVVLPQPFRQPLAAFLALDVGR